MGESASRTTAREAQCSSVAAHENQARSTKYDERERESHPARMSWQNNWGTVKSSTARACALYFEVANVGKTIESSKKRVIWRVKVEDGREFEIILTHSLASGKKVLRIDGIVKYTSQSVRLLTVGEERRRGRHRPCLTRRRFLFSCMACSSRSETGTTSSTCLEATPCTSSSNPLSSSTTCMVRLGRTVLGAIFVYSGRRSHMVPISFVDLIIDGTSFRRLPDRLDPNRAKSSAPSNSGVSSSTPVRGSGSSARTSSYNYSNGHYSSSGPSSRESSFSPWPCSRCTLVNEKPLAPICEACGAPKPDYICALHCSTSISLYPPLEHSFL